MARMRDRSTRGALVLHVVVAMLLLFVAKPAQAHDCCGNVAHACQARPANLPAVCRAGTDTEFECDTLCCIGHALIFDPCPGIIGCSGACPCTPNLPDNQCIDSDGDGLLDSWEINGIDEDGDGVIDVNLPAFGANPMHKDLFLELDFMTGQTPTRAGIQAMKAAFAAAPIGAGGITNNPDGLPGINLWVDTGTLSDPTASEGGVGVATCADGIDNDGNGVMDAADPSCLVGDNLGGGNTIAATTICNLDSNFYAVKAANFSTLRKRAFRYGISSSLAATCPSSGGWGEIGGNDFIEFNHDGGTIMHEFGHTLGLHHGGDVDANCKPNYVSVMNYDNQFGINQVGGGTIFDYSPPRFVGGRGVAPLLQLVENSLNESIQLDATDATNRFVFVNTSGQKVQSRLDQAVNWNNDVDPPFESGLTVNIDTVGTNGRPKACNNSSSNSTLKGFDDWTKISLAFSQFGDSADGAMNPVTDPEPTLQDRVLIVRELNTTDVAIQSSAVPNPVAAGTSLTYTITVTNNGPNPASDVVVVETPSAEVTVLSNNGGCTSGAGSLVCNLGEIEAGQSQFFNVVTRVDPAAVYHHGGPFNLENNSDVDHTKGPDSSLANNAALESTKVVAVADLAILSFVPVSPPTQAVIGQPVTIDFAKTIAQAGPSSPIDVVLVPAVSAPPGTTASPTQASIPETALAIGEARPVSERFSLACQAPGPHTFLFQNTIAPANAADSDPIFANNGASFSQTVTCVVPVAVNIRPGSFPNSVNLNSHFHLAVLTTSLGEYGLPLAFDAARIDPTTVRFGKRSLVFGGGGAVVEDGGHIEDTFELDDHSRDKDPDMVLMFTSTGSGLAVADTEACVAGEFVAPTGERFKFFGCDSIVLK